MCALLAGKSVTTFQVRLAVPEDSKFPPRTSRFRSTVTLDIAEPRPPNPESSTIPTQYASPQDPLRMNFSSYFNGTNLTYRVAGLPAGSGLSATKSGVLSGRVNQLDLAAQPLTLVAIATNPSGRVGVWECGLLLGVFVVLLP